MAAPKGAAARELLREALQMQAAELAQRRAGTRTCGGHTEVAGEARQRVDPRQVQRNDIGWRYLGRAGVTVALIL